jgi:hypothetical protein
LGGFDLPSPGTIGRVTSEPSSTAFCWSFSSRALHWRSHCELVRFVSVIRHPGASRRDMETKLLLARDRPPERAGRAVEPALLDHSCTTSSGISRAPVPRSELTSGSVIALAAVVALAQQCDPVLCVFASGLLIQPGNHSFAHR